MRRSLLAVTAAAVLGLPSAAQAAEGDIIVQRESGADGREVRADAGVKLVEPLPIAHTELVAAAPGREDEALAALRASDDVVFAEPDRPIRATRRPEDPIFSSLWALRNFGQWVFGQSGAAGADIDATVAWERSEGAGVTVAVVDSGIKADHIDLRDQIAVNAAEAGGQPGVDDDLNGKVDDVSGWDFVDNDAVPEDRNGHGTHVAGTIAGAGATPLSAVGVAPAAKVLPLRVLDADGRGSISTLVEALAYAGRRGVRVVNASVTTGDSAALRAVIQANPNTLYVVAAGNDAKNVDTLADAFPCRLPEANVICVGASDNRDEIAYFSNFSNTTVDLFAPGVSIYSTFTSLPYYFLDGTSMAAPHVAGAAALALAARPDASTAFLRYALLSSVDVKPVLRGRSVTGGRLNANGTVAAILGPEPVITPEPTPVPTATPAPPAPAPPVSVPEPVVQPPTPVRPAPAPRLSHLAVSKKLRVTFRLSELASVRLSVSRRGAKRPLASWTLRGRRGANALSLAKRLPTKGKPKLKRGSYTLRVTVGSSPTSVRQFRVRGR